MDDPRLDVRSTTTTSGRRAPATARPRTSDRARRRPPRELRPGLLITLGASLGLLAGIPQAATGVSLGLVPAVGAAVLGADPEPATVGTGDMLPFRRITLYRSGVGAFERQGRIDGDADVRLMIDADLVNDILKSMVMLDLDGGRVESASYGSREPLERRLASFAVDLSDAPGRAELLGRLRGTMVRLWMTPDGVATGRVLSVEEATVPSGDGTARLAHITLSTAEGIQSLRLDQVQRFEIMDERIRQEVERALAAIAEQRTDQVKSIDLAFRGDGTRNVVVSYVHEMPVWKTSYRLVLPPNGSGEPFLQGWAIVENTTDEDWRDVRLGLAAGRPVGFTMDLYEPLYLDRPEVPVPVESAAAPRTYAAGQTPPPAPSARPSASRGMAGRGRDLTRERAVTAGAVVFDMAESSMTTDNFGSSKALASAQESGTVFRFELDEPVTIERRRSAMLPIVSTAIEGRSVSIYSGGRHPMRGIELTNTSGLQLMPGPISVYDDGSYAGDAQIDFVPADDDRLLSFAVDLEVRVQTDTRSTSRVRTVRIVDGVIEETIGREYRYGYTVENADVDGDRTVILEIQGMKDWTLDGPEASEITESGQRFEVDVAGGDTERLDVVFSRIDRSRVVATEYDLNTLIQHERNGRASAAVVAAVRRARELQRAVQDARNLVDALRRERTEIVADQERLRENLARVGSDTQLGRRYVSKLNEQETRLESIASEQAAATDAVRERERALASYLRDLDVS